ncbi:hypothetical protein CGJ02_19830 [Vibrio parahaemolyticus]|nr:hypothetical protein CGJ02_19830 [Vibrio parahaemolyticus]
MHLDLQSSGVCIDLSCKANKKDRSCRQIYIEHLLLVWSATMSQMESKNDQIGDELILSF